MSLRDFDIIEDLKPIGGGWRYMQKRKDGELQRIPPTGAAPTARSLVEMVRTYRSNEGIHVGEVEQDIADYIRCVSPQNDRFRGRPDLYKPRRPDHVPLMQRLRDWIDSVLPKKPRLLTKAEATERAQICIACRQNVKWRIPCAECCAEVDYRGTILRGTPEYALDDALNGCRIHGIHLPSAVFIDRDYLPKRSPEAPDHCWLPTDEPNP